MFCSMIKLKTQLLVIFLASSVLVGCSSDTLDVPETIPVRGTILLKGEPLKKASVVFSNTQSKPNNATANATTDELGKFELTSYFGAKTERKGVLPGTYTVTVLKMMPPGDMTVEEYQAKVAETDKIVSAGGVLTQEQTPPELKQIIPRQYSNVTVSKLQAKVVAGQENNFQFDLK